MSGATITVTGGLHAGARVILTPERDLTIGSGEGADLMLLDEHIEPHHATIRLTNDTLSLVALHDGVAVFGHSLRRDRPTMLQMGACFSIGAASLQFSGRGALTDETVRSAELAWLLPHAPLAYLMKRWSGVELSLKLLLIAVVLIGVTAWIIATFIAPDAPTFRGPRLDTPAYRYVHRSVDPQSGAHVYNGYVQSSVDLAKLMSAARVDGRPPVMHVIVVEQLQEQLGAFLEKYYRGARVSPGEPGSFDVDLPMADSYLLPESWDYARVARLAHAGVDGVREVRFPKHPILGGPVRVPLESLGLNILHGPHVAWLIDRQGTRYFAGARLPIGRISRITGCAATVVRNDDGAVYELFASNADEKKKC
jgi:hypothetical protein